MSWHIKIQNTANWLTQSEQNENAWEIYGALNSLSWSLAAVCGALGNMQIESRLNPGQCEIGRGIPTDGSVRYGGGLGLIQWTDYPAYRGTKNHPLLWNARRLNQNWWSGNFQCTLLDLATDATATDCGEGEGARWGWQTSGSYPSISFSDYKSYSGTPEQAAEYFFYDMEWHYSVENGTLSQRKQNARNWYNYFYGGTPPDPEDPDPPIPDPPTPNPDPDPPIPTEQAKKTNWVYYLPNPNFRFL